MGTIVDSIHQNIDQLPFELRSLASAKNYQGWVFRTINPYLGSRILEIGAGIGNMSKWLPVRERLILTESDPNLKSILQESVLVKRKSDSRISVSELNLTQDNIGFLNQENLDTIVSFNVLEHIEDDHLALTRLCEILRASKSTQTKRLITFVPAHQWAYGSMDQAFGHFRRYSKSSLGRLCKKVAPEASLTLRYFNAFGLAGWVANGRIMKKSSIGMGSISAFESLCPFLAPIDDFMHKWLHLPFGQSLLAVLEWKNK